MAGRPVLFDYELSANAYAVRLMAGLIGIAHDRRPVDVYPGRETEGADFRALNPRGTVPVWVEDGEVLTSVAAILWHMARGAPAWQGGDRAAETIGWLAFAERDLAAADAARLEAMLGLASPIVDPVAAARRAFRILDDRLARQGIDGAGFLVGAAPTVADVAAFPTVALAIDFGEALEAYPKLRAWTRRMRALPGFVTTPGVPDHL